MKIEATKNRLTRVVAGASLLCALAAARFVASASESSVFLFGREVVWGCVFKEFFGVECPGCGLTRSFALALDGDLQRAFALNPGGPLLLLGLLALCAALLLSALARRPDANAQRVALLPRGVLKGATLAYVFIVALFMLMNWARVVVV